MLLNFIVVLMQTIDVFINTFSTLFTQQEETWTNSSQAEGIVEGKGIQS